MHRTRCTFLTLQNRRKWEQRIASVLAEQKETHVDSAAKRFERVYKERRFSPIADKGAPTSQGGPVESSSPPQRPQVVNVAFLGPQNSGKSSLVNALAHAHISSESKRSGSTTANVQAVTTLHDVQLTLVDTPGIVQVRHSKDRRRHAEAALQSWESLFTAHVVVLTLSAGLGMLEPEARSIVSEVTRRASSRNLPVVLAVSKMDVVQTPRQREMYFAFRSAVESTGASFAKTHETSVKDSKGLVELKDTLCTFSIPGPWQFYRNETSALSPQDRVSELLRQTFLDCLPHEIPHGMRHRLIGWTRKKENGGVEVVVEVFFSRPAYLFTFYSKLEAISTAAQRLAEREMKQKFFFVFQGFITPSEISHAHR